MQSVMYSFSGKTSSFCSKPRIFQLESQENSFQNNFYDFYNQIRNTFRLL